MSQVYYIKVETKTRKGVEQHSLSAIAESWNMAEDELRRLL